MRVYFDNAATTPLDPEVIKSMYDVMVNYYGNPSSIHQEGRQAKTLIEKARKSVANLLGVAPGELFFTSGGTEADNMAIRCVAQDLGVTHIISSRIEHHAVLHTIESCHKTGMKVQYVNLTENGHADLQHLETLLREVPKGKCLVSLMHANNEIGNLLDVEKVGSLCKEFGAYFHCDMVQTIGHLPIDLRKAGVHFTAASAHKFNGPKGIGFIYLDSHVKIKPFIHGGSQERNMRGGTENIYGIIGLAKALEIAYAEMPEQTSHIQELKDYMIARLQETVPDIKFNGDYNGQNLYTVLNVAFPPNPATDMLLFNLDIEGVAASGGSACSSGSDAGSHVLRELAPKPGYTSVRFSFGKYNSKEEVDFVIGKLKSILKLENAQLA
ncbi:MAG: cysteine desulfurase family protein [Bacteroidia bacterium]